MLQGYGFRIQKSSFEARITADKYKQLLLEIPNYISDEDSVKVYRIIGKDSVRTFGKDNSEEQEDVIII